MPEPTWYPSNFPTERPSRKPTLYPTREPRLPTSQPISPSLCPSISPSAKPTIRSTSRPSGQPTLYPTTEPTSGPTLEPTWLFTSDPSPFPTTISTSKPTLKPSPLQGEPESMPEPTWYPVPRPVTPEPTKNPSVRPIFEPESSTVEPTEDTFLPTQNPSTTIACTDDPYWAKNNDPSKDCLWISGKPSTRCFVRGADGRKGFEACLCQCIDITFKPSVSPTFLISTPTRLAESSVHPTPGKLVLNEPSISPSLLIIPSILPTLFEEGSIVEPTHAPSSKESYTVILSSNLMIVGVEASEFGENEISAFESIIRSILDDQRVRIEILKVVNLRRLRHLLDEEDRLRIAFDVIFPTVSTSADDVRETFVKVMTTAIADSSFDDAMSTSDSNLSSGNIDKDTSLSFIESTIVNVEVIEETNLPTVSNLEDSSSNNKSSNIALVAIAIILTVCLAALICIGFLYNAFQHREKKRSSTAQMNQSRWTVQDSNDETESTQEESKQCVMIYPDIDNGLPRTDLSESSDDDDMTTAKILLKTQIEKKQMHESNWGKYRRFDWNQGTVLWSSNSDTIRHNEESYVRTFGDASLNFVLATTKGGVHNLTPNNNLSSCPNCLRSDLEKTISRSFTERMDAFRKQTSSLRVPWQIGRVQFQVRRNNIAGDAYACLDSLKNNAEYWRRPFFISFVGEEALDAGGCSREFFEQLTKELFDVSYGLFRYASGYKLQIANDDDSFLAFPHDLEERFCFLGHIIGKALLEGHHIGAHPSIILLKHLVAEPLSLKDLQALDYHFWKNLEMLKRMSAEEIDALALTFAVQHDGLGQSVEKELVPGGAHIPVTKANLNEFLQLRLKDRVLDVCCSGLSAFLRGVYDIIPVEYAMLLSSRELELALCGVPEISVHDWKNATQYRGDFLELGPDHPTIKIFWEIIHEWPNDKRARLLQWCTGTSSVPAQGFHYLQGRDGEIRAFTLTSISLDLAVYPRSHTCFNRIDLPVYEKKKFMAEALDFVLTPAFAEAFSMD
uniref:HECT-type E3 ubiquitin transferase n=1 Tax=Aureoumbra lagunensis TaxID=44058 RepID=A0A7S3JW87_9STRA